MIRAKHYAAVLRTLDTEQVLAYMRHRGHLSLLPQVLSILEREQPRPASKTVTAAEDPRIVGGSYTLDGYMLEDRTYRTALVQLYKKITA